MPIAVECYVDEEYSERVRRLWALLQSHLPALGYRPHFSMAVFDEVDIETLRPIVDEFSVEQKQFVVDVTSLGAFCTDPAVVFLAISKTKELIDLHAKFHAMVASRHLQPVSYYSPNKWTPHITLNQWLDYESLGRSVAVAAPLCETLVGPAMVTEIGIIRCNPSRRTMDPAALR